MRIVLFAMLGLALSLPALGQQQNVVIDPVPRGLGTSESFTLEVRYWSASPAEPDLTGLGLRLHWNSAKLSLVGLTDVLSHALVGQGTPEVDGQDFDTDGDTNRFVHVAWADLAGEWPGGMLPWVVARATFTTSSTYDGITDVNLSASATAAGYRFGPRLVFADGFETGDPTAWSAAVGALPPPPPGIAAVLAGASDGAEIFEVLVGLSKRQDPGLRLSALPLDIDGDGNASAGTDGLLALRYLFGFRGEALIADALAPGATRITAAEIVAFLDALSPLLDIDLDGRRVALTDGLLIARYLDGYRGETLVAGAVAPDGLRVTASEITGYLDAVADPDPDGDTDGDGLSNFEEATGYEIVLDLVGLGIADPGWLGSLTHRWVTSDPFVTDTDGDGLDDHAERLYRTDPRAADSDTDGIDDPTELGVYGSVPTTVDTDGDARGPDGTLPPNPLFFDGNELARYGTSPALADSDGDARSDFEEANQNGAHPLVANVPRLEIEQVGEIDITLDYSRTAGQNELFAESSLASVTDTTGQSSTDSTTSEWSVNASATVTAGVEAGFPGGASASVEASVTVSGGYSEQNTASFTEDSSVSTQNEFQSTQEIALANSRTVEGGSLGLGLVLRNLGDVAFNLRNLVLTALLSDPFDRTQFRPIASLLPPLGDGGITLGPFNGESGVLRVSTDNSTGNLDVDLVEQLMRDPSGLFFEVATFDLLDDEGRNFAFLNEITHARTALLTIDFGDGTVERYRVATLVERDADGSSAGVPLGHLLTDILEVPFETVPRTGSTDPLFPDGVEVLTSVRGVTTAIDPDPAAYQRTFWAVLSANPDLTGTPGAPFTTDFGDIALRSGDSLSLAYVIDHDNDGLFASEEFLYGTADSPRDLDGDGDIDATDLARLRDFDQDGLSDFFEARTGWTVAVEGLPARPVRPDPTRTDTDADRLTDDAEFALGTDPYLRDTDRDGLQDDIDDEPLANTNAGPILALDFSLSASQELRVTGTVTDVIDKVKQVAINWGDGTGSTVINLNPASSPVTIDRRHQFHSTGTFDVVITAKDGRQPPGVPGTSETTHVLTVAFPDNELAFYPFDAGSVDDASGNGFDGDSSFDLAFPAVDRFGSGQRAYCFENPNAGEGCPDIRFPHLPVGAQPGGAQLAVTAWIVPGRREGHILGQNEFLRLFFDNGRLTFAIDDGPGGLPETKVPVPSGTTIPVVSAGDETECLALVAPANWTFVAGVVAKDGDDTVLTIYLGNGATLGQVTDVGTVRVPNASYANPSTTDNFWAGGFGGNSECDSGSPYSGWVDDVRVYDRALGEAELNALLNAGPTP